VGAMVGLMSVILAYVNFNLIIKEENVFDCLGIFYVVIEYTVVIYLAGVIYEKIKK
jgi:hypothetical protein